MIFIGKSILFLRIFYGWNYLKEKKIFSIKNLKVRHDRLLSNSNLLKQIGGRIIVQNFYNQQEFGKENYPVLIF